MSGEHIFSRTELLIGSEGLARLRAARVAVFGVGGVGGYVVEALARSGVGTLDLIDSDRVCLSNLNRQIIAIHRTLGQYKVDAARDRVLDINPEAVVNTYRIFYLPETAGQFDFTKYDYVVDAIDTVSGKLMLIGQAREAGVPIISSMGAGNKLNPAAFEVADISETSVCPLARVMRRELKKRGIEHLKVVYSKEAPLTPRETEESGQEKSGGDKMALSGRTADAEMRAGADQVKAPLSDECPSKEPDTGQSADQVRRRRTPGSIAFVPSVAGLILAGEVIKDLLVLEKPFTE